MGRAQIKNKAQFKIKKLTTDENPYSRFEEINGQHPWQSIMPEGCILYPTRRLNAGKVVYFNFVLAKEMGLLPHSHSEEINSHLHKKILDTFSLQIINEYDQKQNIQYHPSALCNNKYMATRYLQLQHSDKTGRTSGDGRSIWNGVIYNKGCVWDISSRGTGVTQLAPGAVDARRPLKTGSTSFGYGCGTADMDELLSSAIMAEIFHNNGIETERVLAVIDLGKGLGIGVRAGKNLFRPAHLFMYLKQNSYESLKKATDFYIDRQYQNKDWSFNSKDKSAYNKMLEEICESFAYFAAHLDRNYIFAWLDWDGDNVLANAGIIDYGSIRQFGLRHDEYRYNDIERYSTSLNEQKIKARQIVQVFTQLVDYLNTGTKKSIQTFAEYSILQKFDEHFSYYLRDYFLQQMGFSRADRETLLTQEQTRIEELYQSFAALESLKTRAKTRRVPDGINRPAILNMRQMLCDLAEYISNAKDEDTDELLMPPETFIAIALAESANISDQKLTKRTTELIINFQRQYLAIAQFIFGSNYKAQLKKNLKRARTLNRTDRLTGDGILYAVDELMRHMRKSSGRADLQHAINALIAQQSPQSLQSRERLEPKLHANRRLKTLVRTMLELIDGLKESI